MNKEQFDRLPEEKKKVIERAYIAALNKKITPSDFFDICRDYLTPVEYSLVFGPMKKEPTLQSSPKYAKPQEQGMSENASKDKEEIKTEHIEDIMQYSGVDLKKEAENIVREAEHNVSLTTYDEVDWRDTPESMFNLMQLRNTVTKLMGSRGVKISEEAFGLVWRVLKRKILDLLDKLDEASQIRVDGHLSEFNFQIENEVTKQLWYLNELEKIKMEKLVVKKTDDSKKKRAVQEREDILIKKRQSNSVAMAAMGLKHKSWMSNAGGSSGEEVGKFNSIYSPFDEKSFEKKIETRAITMKDFIYVFERDKRYNKSVFLIQHYFK